MRIQDTEFDGMFIRDDDNPEYIIATDRCFITREPRDRLIRYLAEKEDRIFIFLTHECVDPDLTIFDYAFTWNSELTCGDRIVHCIPYIYTLKGCPSEQSEYPLRNDITRDNAASLLSGKTGFCNFIYSHGMGHSYRDNFFHLLSQRRHVDSLGPWLHNTDTEPNRNNLNWYELSVRMKSPYKFSIAIENATYKGYTSEKIISSLQAHTVPIYWGNPVVSDYINPKAFINCHDYTSPEEVIERVMEIDSNNDEWIDMVSQPWQTEEQRAKVISAADEYYSAIRHIFTQDLKEARRRPEGLWGNLARRSWGRTIKPRGALPVRVLRKMGRIMSKYMSRKTKRRLKEFLGLGW